MEPGIDTTTKTTYFMAKVVNIHALKRCIETCKWACKDRVSPPHPKDILREAFKTGPVVIIFSVNNCHGYHGYAEMTTSPGEPAADDEFIHDKGTIKKESENKNYDLCPDFTSTNPMTNVSDVNEMQSEHICISSSNQDKTTNTYINDDKESKIEETWHYFNINWKVCFLNDFGEQCLPFTKTEDLLVHEDVDNLPLNKCRNWQAISDPVGQKVCDLLEKHYSDLCSKRDMRMQRQIDKQPKAFYDNTQEGSIEQTWRQIVNQVEKDLGKVILACPFGSQRYNLSTPDSDTDMFIVYQARTEQVLGFNPPKQTIKNSERETCDYTIHEVFRYCELLLSGDGRCVETLFLHDSTVVCESEQWKKLKEGRQLVLNKECLNKYLRDAQGSKGTKYLRKWCNDNKKTDILPPKMCKMLYVIVRLLQNARDIVSGGDLLVYRENGSEAREQLMCIRKGGVPVAMAWEIIDKLEAEISQKADQVPEKSEELTKFVEQWLLELRHKDFKEPGKSDQ